MKPGTKTLAGMLKSYWQQSLSLVPETNISKEYIWLCLPSISAILA
jgi:hypothetical protein